MNDPMPSGGPSAGGHPVSPAPESVTQDFWVYGLRVRSAIDLPGWPTVATTEPDVVIRRESLSGPEVEGPPYSARGVVEAGEFRLAVLGVGRFGAIGGSLIRVDPDPAAKAEDLRLYLTGSVMGTILHQRGAYPLHASCVAPSGGGGCVGFAGRSGAGKSTLVATMLRRGAAFVSDDICVMAPPARGELRVWPGAARLKLDGIALADVPGTVSDLEPAGGGRGKFHLPITTFLHHTSPAPLSRVYILTDGEGPPRLERLTGLEAISALVDQTYLLASARALGLTSQVFRLAATVARALSVSRLIRPRGLEYLSATASLIEHDTHHPAECLHAV